MDDHPTFGEIELDIATDDEIDRRERQRARDLIIRAVNAHDPMLKALKRLMDQPTMHPLSMTPEQREELWAAHAEARAAIAKATGGE